MMKMSKSMLMAAVICGSFSMLTAAYGAEAENGEALTDFYLDQIVVTATRTPVEAFKAQANVSVLTAEQIEKRHYKDLYYALRDVPGVQTYSYGQAGYLTSNGFRINGSDKVVVLIDGIRANQASEIFNIGSISNMDNIERVEVLKGAASALYGADAQGGVVNIITKRGGAGKSKVYFDAGNFGRRDYGVSVNAKSGKLGVSVGANKKKEGDFHSPHQEEIISRQQSNNYNVNINYDLKENSNIGFHYDVFDNHYQYVDPGKNPIGNTNIGSYDSKNARLIWNQEFDADTHNVFALGYNRKDFRPSWGRTAFKSFLIQEQFSKKAGAHLLSAGIDYENSKVLATSVDYTTGHNATGESFATTAYYLQDQINLSDKLKFIAGIRYTSPDSFESKWTPSFNLGYEFNDRTNMYVGWSKFFDTPGLYQLFDSQHGTPGLKPEDGKNFEVGLNHKFDDKTAAALHYFYRNTTNFIDFEHDKLDPSKGHFFNRDNELRTKGFDVQVTKAFDEHWRMNVGYTYLAMPATGTGIKEQENFGGYMPRGAWNIGVDYADAKYDVGLTGRGIIKRPGYQVTNGHSFPKDSYWVFDMNMSYKPEKNLKLYANIYNLFNQYYAENSDVYWKGFGWGSLSDDYNWWPMPGRAFIMGVEYSF